VWSGLSIGKRLSGAGVISRYRSLTMHRCPQGMSVTTVLIGDWGTIAVGPEVGRSPADPDPTLVADTGRRYNKLI
jgi:hypothetical protein